MNRGTVSGNEAEIKLVKLFNKNKESNKFNEYINNLNIKNTNTIFMVRVSTKQYSKLSNQNVMTRADAYLIQSDDKKTQNILIENDYYLDEEIIKNNKINYKYINYSGISIKISDSKNFQIIKFTPDSFYTIFGEYELGAGASIYCRKEEELVKNDDVCEGWHTSEKKIIEKYSKNIPKLELLISNELSNSEKISVYKELKTFSNKKIAEIIDENKRIQEIIFNGYYIYEEPYSASYFYKGDSIKKLSYIPYTVTTGSGRSKGDFTIVLKPKNETTREF